MLTSASNSRTAAMRGFIDLDKVVVITTGFAEVGSWGSSQTYRLVCVLFWGVQQLTFEQYLHKIAPRRVYASGKGSSAVRLTAYVTRNKQLVLERYVANL